MQSCRLTVRDGGFTRVFAKNARVRSAEFVRCTSGSPTMASLALPSGLEAESILP